MGSAVEAGPEGLFVWMVSAVVDPVCVSAVAAVSLSMESAYSGEIVSVVVVVDGVCVAVAMARIVMVDEAGQGRIFSLPGAGLEMEDSPSLLKYGPRGVRLGGDEEGADITMVR